MSDKYSIVDEHFCAKLTSNSRKSSVRSDIVVRKLSQKNGRMRCIWGSSSYSRCLYMLNILTVTLRVVLLLMNLFDM
jgi:hypothetical protein